MSFVRDFSFIKKLSLCFAFSFFAPMKYCFSILTIFIFSTFAFSQTIVSTEQQNKTAVLEYFEGIYCGYCPEADGIAMQLAESLGDEIVIINIQSGYFAIPTPGDPDLRTEWGWALDQLSGNGQYYPAGTINRHHFPGLGIGSNNSTAMGRNVWEYAAHHISEQNSPVNVALEASFDPTNNTITIYLEYYYTSDCLSDTNYLHVALLQNQVIAPQLLEDQTIDPDYAHNFLLRDFISPQWGIPITNTSAGHFESHTFSYTLPATFRDVIVDISQLEIAAFISVDQQEILSGASRPVVVNEAVSDIDINLWATNLSQNICHDKLRPNVIIRNDGSEPLSEVVIAYAVNDGPTHNHEWKGTLNSFEAVNVALPPIEFEAQYGNNNTLQVQVATSSSISEDNNLSNNIIYTPIADVPSAPSPVITLELRTDDFGYETYWEILDSEGNLVVAGGNQNIGANGGGQQMATADDPGAYFSNYLYTQTIELPGFDCYEFRILDDYADGICCEYGTGFYRIKDENGAVLLNGGHFDMEKIDPFRVSVLATALKGDQSTSYLNIFPNPVQADQFNVQLNTLQKGNVDVSIFDTRGKRIVAIGQKQLHAGQNEWRISTSNLAAGMYILQLQFEDQILTEKVLVIK